MSRPDGPASPPRGEAEPGSAPPAGRGLEKGIGSRGGYPAGDTLVWDLPPPPEGPAPGAEPAVPPAPPASDGSQ